MSEKKNITEMLDYYTPVDCARIIAQYTKEHPIEKCHEKILQMHRQELGSEVIIEIESETYFLIEFCLSCEYNRKEHVMLHCARNPSGFTRLACDICDYDFNSCTWTV